MLQSNAWAQPPRHQYRNSSLPRLGLHPPSALACGVAHVRVAHARNTMFEGLPPVRRSHTLSRCPSPPSPSKLFGCPLFVERDATPFCSSEKLRDFHLRSLEDEVQRVKRSCMNQREALHSHARRFGEELEALNRELQGSSGSTASPPLPPLQRLDLSRSSISHVPPRLQMPTARVANGTSVGKCSCGNVLMLDSLFCRRCGLQVQEGTKEIHDSRPAMSLPYVSRFVYSCDLEPLVDVHRVNFQGCGDVTKQDAAEMICVQAPSTNQHRGISATLGNVHPLAVDATVVAATDTCDREPASPSQSIRSPRSFGVPASSELALLDRLQYVVAPSSDNDNTLDRQPSAFRSSASLEGDDVEALGICSITSAPRSGFASSTKSAERSLDAERAETISVLSNLLLSDTASTVKSLLSSSRVFLSTDGEECEVELMATEGGTTSEPTGRQVEEDFSYYDSNQWSELADNADQVSILGECIASVLGRGLIDIALLSDSCADLSPALVARNTIDNATESGTSVQREARTLSKSLLVSCNTLDKATESDSGVQREDNTLSKSQMVSAAAGAILQDDKAQHDAFRNRVRNAVLMAPLDVKTKIREIMRERPESA